MGIPPFPGEGPWLGWETWVYLSRYTLLVTQCSVLSLQP